MQARAQLRWTQVPAGVVRMFILGVLVALFVGAAGGYLVRGLSFTPASTTPTTHPYVIESAPYSSPAPSAIPEPIRDPNGHAVPI